MHSSSIRTFVLRFALVLAIAQLVAYAAAPVLEGMTEQAVGRPAIHNGHQCSTVTLHEASNCLACQLLIMSAQRSDPKWRLHRRLARLLSGSRLEPHPPSSADPFRRCAPGCARFEDFFFSGPEAG